MAGSVLSETIIPKAEGRAFELQAGQVLRLTATAGKQVGDVTTVNLHDFREWFSATYSPQRNNRSVRRVERLYSGPPFYRAMLAIENDSHGFHWLGGRCSRTLYESLGAPGHRNCHDNIVEALRPYGIKEHEVRFDTFNAFMVVDYDSDGHFSFRPPVIEKGDFIDLRALIDVLVAVSACPNEGQLAGEINDYVAKPLKVEVLDG